MIDEFFAKYGHIFADAPDVLDKSSLCIEANIQRDLIEYVRQQDPDSLLIVGDVNTWKVAGEHIYNILTDSKLKAESFVFPPTESQIVPDEEAVELLLQRGAPGRLFIAVGSGTINDLVRYAAYATGNKYISIPTAPSMDGYASSVSPLIRNGVKQTVSAHSPEAVFIQPSLLATAPQRMISAGIGDLIGKYSSLLDWQLAATFTDEPLTSPLVDMISESRDRYFREYRSSYFTPESCSALIWNLIVTGLAMTVNGNSRPASGSEHHISHLLEMQALQHRARHFLHGETVGLGSWIILNMYRFVLSKSLAELKEFRSNSSDTRQKRLLDAYGDLSDSFIKSWKVNASHRQSLGACIEKKPEIWDSFRSRHQISPENFSELESIYYEAQLHTDLQHFGYDRDQIVNVIIGAKEIRNRVTVLDFLDSLGCLEHCAEYIVAKLYE